MAKQVRYKVRYHRAILDSDQRVLYPSGTILERLDMIPAGQQDRVLVYEEDGEDEEEREEGDSP